MRCLWNIKNRWEKIDVAYLKDRKLIEMKIEKDVNHLIHHFLRTLNLEHARKEEKIIRISKWCIVLMG